MALKPWDPAPVKPRKIRFCYMLDGQLGQALFADVETDDSEGDMERLKTVIGKAIANEFGVAIEWKAGAGGKTRNRKPVWPTLKDHRARTGNEAP